METRTANGLRKSPYIELTAEEITKLKEDIKAIEAEENVFMFNQGTQTSYSDRFDFIFVVGDVLPDTENSIHPRDLMSSRAVLAHEYYGHRIYRNTALENGAWNDEFRASYMAARNAPGLTLQDRVYLIMDAMDRAKEAGVKIKLNSFMMEVLYGDDYVR